MIKGLYISSLGMLTQMQRIDVVSNNIANSATTGFKRDIVVTQTFSEELLKRLEESKDPLANHENPMGKITYGVGINSVYTDFTRGNMMTTDNTLDFALDGPGFFCVSVVGKDGETTERYTRDGAFLRNADGFLSTKEGNLVMGENGPIEVTVGREVTGLKIVDFENPQSLRKIGDNLYMTTESSVQTETRANPVQGMLESSNINTVREMIELISLSRNYEANQKLVTIHDNIMGRATADIGRK